jgi:hypothetical protein
MPEDIQLTPRGDAGHRSACPVSSDLSQASWIWVISSLVPLT